ncbi:MAG: septum formation initiator family protein [Chitinophagales bacterium]|nr:septum formation initiator family protein [Chitinophagales bacterium]MDW8427528.1 septum formation initiator family protein [Chitinophagales bacterium]
MYQKIYPFPSWLRNKYVVVLLFFAIWMLLLDRYNLISQVRLYHTLKSLERKQAFYEKEIQHLREQKQILLNNPQQLEKVAREQFLMKRPNEDLYIILPPQKP